MSWNRKLKALDEAFEVRNKSSKEKRAELDQKFFKVANEFLGRLGVEFETVNTDRTRSLDPKQPVVPAWNFAAMTLALEILAESIEDRPKKDPNKLATSSTYIGHAISQERCKECVHCSASSECHLGFPVDFFQDGIETVQDNCPGFKKLSVRVLRLKEQKISQ